MLSFIFLSAMFCLSSAYITPSSRTQRRSSSPRLHDAALTSLEILDMIEPTKRGVTATPELKEVVNSWIESKRSITENVEVPVAELVGNYEVSFVSEGEKQKSTGGGGNPAGGYYRGKIGRMLYFNKGLYQHLYEVNEKLIAVNYVSGRLLRVLPLEVVLFGTAEKLTESERKIESARPTSQGVLGVNTVRANFEPPRIMLGIGKLITKILFDFFPFDIVPNFMHLGIRSFLKNLDLVFAVGPVSSVVLDTPFVDETLRVGVGSRGSQFLFERILPVVEDSSSDYSNNNSNNSNNNSNSKNKNHNRKTAFEESELWRDVKNAKPLDSKSIAVGGSFAGAAMGILGKRRVGLVLSVLSIVLYYWKGGIADNGDSRVA